MAVPMIAGLVAIMVVIADIVISVRFRMGKGSVFRSRDSVLRWYRSPNASLLWRTVPILAALPAGLVLPLVFQWTLAPLVSVPNRLHAFWMFGSLAGLLVGLGLFALIAYLNPSWLVPRWLAEDDRRVGYEAPAPDLFDKFTVFLFGVLGSILGIGFLGLAFAYALFGRQTA